MLPRMLTNFHLLPLHSTYSTLETNEGCMEVIYLGMSEASMEVVRSSAEASIEVVEASMEVPQTYMEVVEASMEAGAVNVASVEVVEASTKNCTPSAEASNSSMYFHRNQQ